MITIEVIKSYLEENSNDKFNVFSKKSTITDEEYYQIYYDYLHTVRIEIRSINDDFIIYFILPSHKNNYFKIYKTEKELFRKMIEMLTFLKEVALEIENKNETQKNIESLCKSVSKLMGE